MSSAAGTLLGEAAKRAVAALGVGMAGRATLDEATKEVARKRQEEADEAKRNTPVGPLPGTPGAEKCKKCPPEKGERASQSTAGWSDASISYQVRIAQMPPAPAGILWEWFFNGVQFDGFDPALCLLKEAKAKYDQFFDELGHVEDFWVKGEAKLIDEAMRQGSAAQPRPPTRLRWHFMQPLSYRYFSKIIQAAHPDVEVVYQP